MSHHHDRALDPLLAKQHGAFNREQATALGFTRRMVQHRLATGAWRSLDHCVYAHAAYPATWEQRCAGAILAEPFAVLGTTTAAVVHRLPGFRRGAVMVTVPPDASHRDRVARVHRSALVDPVVVDGFRVQSVPVTLIEVAAVSSQARLDRAIEDAILRELTTIDRLGEWYLRVAHSRRPGTGRLRTFLETHRDGFVPPESELEALLFAALDVPGIPPITRQSRFPWSPDDPQRVDGFLAAWGIVLEADGRRWHARLAAMDADRRRDQEAVRHGLVPLRFGWTDLRDHPERVRRVVLDAGQAVSRRATASIMVST